MTVVGEVNALLDGEANRVMSLEQALASGSQSLLIRSETDNLDAGAPNHLEVCDSMESILSPYGFARSPEGLREYMYIGKKFHSDGLGVLPYWQVHTTLVNFDGLLAASKFVFTTFRPSADQHLVIRASIAKCTALSGSDTSTYLDHLQEELRTQGLPRLESESVTALTAQPLDTVVFKNGYNALAEYAGEPLVVHAVESVDVDTDQPNGVIRYAALTRFDPYA